MVRQGVWKNCDGAHFGTRPVPRKPQLELRAGALDVARGLAPSPHRDTQLRMWRWYARNHSGALALRPWWRTQLQRLGAIGIAKK